MARAVRYRILRKIAHGGMAEIFLALQTGAEGFQKSVVLKRILPAFAADPHFVRMLVDEAHIASSLNHSHLVQVLDLGKSGGQFFLVLEFVDGWSLEQVRRRAPATPGSWSQGPTRRSTWARTSADDAAIWTPTMPVSTA